MPAGHPVNALTGVVIESGTRALVNWLGTAYAIKAVLPHMLLAGRGRIVVARTRRGAAARLRPRYAPAPSADSGC